MNNLDYYRKYNPEGSALREAQMKMLKMIQFLDAICKENNITYFLDAGTALGAVRHHGFIPWDDDLDIVLLERDYKRLCDVLLKLDSDEYVLQCQRTDSNYVALFPKFRMRKGNYRGCNPNRSKLYKWRGIGIDIFCLKETNYLAARISSVVRHILLDWTWRINNSLIRLITTKFLFLLFYLSYPLYIIVGTFHKKGELHYLFGQGWPENTFFIDWYNDVKCESFEGVQLPIPIEYESVLTSLYGDWRQIPSEEEIKNNGIHTKDLL